jgi:hypothetical protein
MWKQGEIVTALSETGLPALRVSGERDTVGHAITLMASVAEQVDQIREQSPDPGSRYLLSGLLRGTGRPGPISVLSDARQPFAPAKFR